MSNKIFTDIRNLVGPKHYFALLTSVVSLTVIAPLVDHYLWARIVVASLVLLSLLTASLAVSPNGRLARAISWLEGLAGQLYLAILVARLVGLHVAGTMTDSTDSSQRVTTRRELERSRR